VSIDPRSGGVALLRLRRTASTLGDHRRTAFSSVRARRAALLLASVLLLAACASPDRPTVQAEEVALPTPMRTFDASVGATITALEAAAATVGERLEAPAGAYRPSEPEALLQVPRVVRRVALADPDDGYVIVYEAASSGEAIRLADELADYVGSGFGQTNYVADTQFSVSVLADTIVFTTWSQRRSDDPERAEAVFEALGRVGSPVEVSK
jgi:hypothetical protein